MGINIRLDGITIKDNAEMLTNVKIKKDSQLEVETKNVELCNKAKLLTDLEVEEVNVKVTSLQDNKKSKE